MSRRARPAQAPPPGGWETVKVVLVCPENPAHILGAVGRQVHAVPGSPAGREPVADENGLREEYGPDGERKLIGSCRPCAADGSRRTVRLRWERVRSLLDRAQDADNGVLHHRMTD